jgi:hypothetical protein
MVRVLSLGYVSFPRCVACFPLPSSGYRGRSLRKPCGSPPSPVLWGHKTARHFSVIPPVDPWDHVPPDVRGVPLGVGGDGELSWVPGQSLWKHAPG